eukprot:c18482_g1_i2.p1 GENE.c18482_g1_i2~~c18482_g1_i2.p1  ORF type:complete len:468 (+),score=103.30 c18482_g1_i2:860-2263(+)
MARRFEFGVGVLDSCEQATKLYLHVAQQQIASLSREVRLFDAALHTLSHPYHLNQDLEYEEYRVSRRGWIVEHLKLLSTGVLPDPAALVRLGRLHLLGVFGVEESPSKALNHLLRAKDLDAAAAYAVLGYMHYYGIGLPQSVEAAAEEFVKGVRRGDALAYVGLGDLHFDGLSVPADVLSPVTGKARAEELYQKAAQGNLALGHYRLAKLHKSKVLPLVSGLSTEEAEERRQKNSREAQAYFQALTQAASLGHVEAKLDLAKLYRDDLSDCDSALRWVRDVVQTTRQSQVLRPAYEAFIENKITTALARYLDAATQGLEHGFYNAAYLLHHYHPTIPLPQNTTRDLYTESVQRYGHVNAYASLGDFEFYVANDTDAAVQAYRNGARLGDAESAFAIGYMLEWGIGVPANLTRAREHYVSIISMRHGSRAVALLALCSWSIHTWVEIDWRDWASRLLGKFRSWIGWSF